MSLTPFRKPKHDFCWINALENPSNIMINHCQHLLRRLLSVTMCCRFENSVGSCDLQLQFTFLPGMCARPNCLRPIPRPRPTILKPWVRPRRLPISLRWDQGLIGSRDHLEIEMSSPRSHPRFLSQNWDVSNTGRSEDFLKIWSFYNNTMFIRAVLNIHVVFALLSNIVPNSLSIFIWTVAKLIWYSPNVYLA